jgi:pilus assembly protein FimV
VIKDLRIKLSAVLAVAMFASPLSAWALGLGQIQVISQRDQPLLAEIPIISNDPTELETLQARLASPETFARIGLAPPQGIVSDLQFAVALSASGRPVIRVTSAAPVQQPLLTFLIEVNWGQGRLVREYSALVDTPQTAAAPVQPSIEEAVAEIGTVETPTSGAIVRAPEPLPPEPLPAQPPAPQPTRPDFAAAPTAIPLNPQPAASASPSVAPAVPLPLPSASGQTHTVRPGETLAGIASGLQRSYGLDQTIVALLRTNPDAFIGGNANRLKAGAVLRIPDDAGIARYTPEEAALVVREQAAQWRGAGRALPQPPAVAGAPAGDASAAPAASGVRTARASAGARLEITPPSANDARKAGSRSGVSAGGEGDMLRQQELQQTRETLAARDAEVQELKARVSELEQLQKKQNELIAMKDSELAAAQQRMAAAQGESSAGGVGLWAGIGGGLVLIAVGAWWFLRRRVPVATPAPAPPARRRETERLAAAIPKASDSPAASPEPAGDTGPVADAAAPLPAEPAWSRMAKPAEPEAPKPRPAALGKPTWHAGAVEVAPLAAAARTPPTPAAAQPPARTEARQAELPVGDPSGFAPATPAPGQGRLDLALAYIDMGDRDAARELLQVVATRGATVELRREAERLLQELG